MLQFNNSLSCEILYSVISMIFKSDDNLAQSSRRSTEDLRVTYGYVKLSCMLSRYTKMNSQVSNMSLTTKKNREYVIASNVLNKNRTPKQPLELSVR